MIKKIYYLASLMGLALIAPTWAQADFSLSDIVQKTQRNYTHILSMSGSYQRFSTVDNMPANMTLWKYSYKTGRQMQCGSASDQYDKADGVYEYHVNGDSQSKKKVMPDDLFYLPYSPVISMDPTLLSTLDLHAAGEDSVGNQKVHLVEGSVIGKAKSGNRIVWKVEKNSGAVLEVDEYDAQGNFAIKMEISYNLVKNIYVPSKVVVNNQGKILHTKVECNYIEPVMDVSALSQAEIDQNKNLETNESQPTSTPTAIIAKAFVSAVSAGPNVSHGEPVNIRFTLGQSAQVNLHIYTLLGSEVYSQTVQGNEGANQLVWAVQNKAKASVTSGLYVYVLNIDNGIKSEHRTGKIAILH